MPMVNNIYECVGNESNFFNYYLFVYNTRVNNTHIQTGSVALLTAAKLALAI